MKSINRSLFKCASLLLLLLLSSRYQCVVAQSEVGLDLGKQSAPVVDIQHDYCEGLGFQEQIACRLERYLSFFPQSQLCDVYKYCFQDFFGLEHLLTDSVSAARYIEYEISHADTADWQLSRFYYGLLLNNYVRVDIGYVREGIIPLGTLVSAMLKSTVSVDYDNEMWRERWHQILDILQTLDSKPLNYDEDYKLIEKTIDAGKYALHHSRLFNATYHQHYRIVRRDVFEEILLPLIGE